MTRASSDPATSSLDWQGDRAPAGGVDGGSLADPVAGGRRLIDAAREQGTTVRVITDRDERDIYSRCHSHEISDLVGAGIEAGVIGEQCANDWGLWRTCKGTIERCRADVDRKRWYEEPEEV